MQNKTSNLKKIIYLAICLLSLSIGYWLIMESDQPRGAIELTQDLPNDLVNASTDSKSKMPKKLINTGNVGQQVTPSVISKLTLLAVVVAQPAINSSAVIQFDLESDNYAIGESIRNTEVVLQEVWANYVTVSLDGQQYQLSLKGGEAEIYLTNKNSKENQKLSPMTAKEIGNRPKQLEHIILISPENNDYFVKPGLNPALFKSVQFKPGDQLQSINGKDVTVPEELAAANALIAAAQTLEFKVLRNGQTVTLYLDIPGKDLTIKAN